MGRRRTLAHTVALFQLLPHGLFSSRDGPKQVEPVCKRQRTDDSGIYKESLPTGMQQTAAATAGVCCKSYFNIRVSVDAKIAVDAFNRRSKRDG
jgi:hypothetical protein